MLESTVFRKQHFEICLVLPVLNCHLPPLRFSQGSFQNLQGKVSCTTAWLISLGSILRSLEELYRSQSREHWWCSAPMLLNWAWASLVFQDHEASRTLPHTGRFQNSPFPARNIHTLLPRDAVLSFHLPPFHSTPPVAFQWQQPRPVLRADELASYFRGHVPSSPPCQPTFLASSPSPN